MHKTSVHSTLSISYHFPSILHIPVVRILKRTPCIQQLILIIYLLTRKMWCLSDLCVNLVQQNFNTKKNNKYKSLKIFKCSQTNYNTYLTNPDMAISNLKTYLSTNKNFKNMMYNRVMTYYNKFYVRKLPGNIYIYNTASTRRPKSAIPWFNCFTNKYQNTILWYHK